jgi:hypothetical protein
MAKLHVQNQHQGNGQEGASTQAVGLFKSCQFIAANHWTLVARSTAHKF